MKFLKVGMTLINVDRIQQVDLEWGIPGEEEVEVRIIYTSGTPMYFVGEEADQIRHFFRTMMRN